MIQDLSIPHYNSIRLLGSDILYEFVLDDEDLTCNVCDRAFVTPWHLERHQQKKRHWG